MIKTSIAVLSLTTLLSSASMAQDDAAAFAKCRACHMVGEGAKNLVGPHLNGLFGRKAGALPDYNYSAANKNSGLTWDEATFREYIKAPRAKIPGTKMAFAGLNRESEIDALVAYLKRFDAEGKRN